MNHFLCQLVLGKMSALVHINCYTPCSAVNQNFIVTYKSAVTN